MAASLIALGLFFAGGKSWAQESARSWPAASETSRSAPSITFHYKKDPAPLVPTGYQASVPASNPVTSVAGPASQSSRGVILPVGYQQTQQSLRAPGEDVDFQVQLDPPGALRLFRLESESALHERMRQEHRERPSPERIQFPEEPVVGRGQYVARSMPQHSVTVEPNYLCYNRLLFEEKNSERYGWDLGFVQPFVSAGFFYMDVATLPYHIWTAPCRKYECNAGYCLPGDPVPYMLYPPEISVNGGFMTAVTWVGLIAIFPI